MKSMFPIRGEEVRVGYNVAYLIDAIDVVGR